MARLIDFFAVPITAALKLEQRLSNRNQALPAPADAQREIEGLIAHAKASALAANASPKDLDLAVFAIVAWADEIMSRKAEWWRDLRPLQVQLFNTHNAGNEFFETLDKLSSTQDEVREVYYAMLCLGFEGEYALDPAGPQHLDRLKDLHGRQLKDGPVNITTLRDERVTPQPYAVDDPAGPKLPAEPAKGRSLWPILAAIAALLLLVVAGALWFLMRPGGPDLEAMRAELARRLRGYDCAMIGASLTNDLVVHASGYVSGANDAPKLQNDLRAIPGVKDVDFGVQTRPWPFCEMLAVMDPLNDRNTVDRTAAAVSFVDHPPEYRAGEFVVAQALGPSFPAYLYMMYLQRDGTIVHMMPSAVNPSRQQTPGTRVVVGDGRGNSTKYEVLPPFGEEMIAMIASSQPLFTSPRPEFEKIGDLMPTLKAAIAASEAARNPVVGHYIYLRTRER